MKNLTAYDPPAGTELEAACAYMADNAPCVAKLNGVHVRSEPGDTASGLLARLRAEMDAESKRQQGARAVDERIAAYQRALCVGAISAALVMLRAGDTATTESMLCSELRRLNGD